MTAHLTMVDLSSNNRQPTAAGLRRHYAAGHRTLALKATEGTSYVWMGGDELAAIWHRLGGNVWHYHFAQPGDGNAQARHFLDVVSERWRAGDRLVLDAEVSGVGPALVKAFIDHCHTRRAYFGGRPGVVYSYASFLTSRKIRPVHGWGLWLAAYGPSEPKPVAGWTRLDAWQHTDRGHVPGIPGSVDVSHLYPHAAVRPSHPHKPTKKEPKVKHAIKRKSKALAALVGGVVTWVTAALSDGHVTTNEWRALVAVLVPAVITYFAPKNAEPKAKRTATDRGHVDLVTALLVFLAVVILLVVLLPVLHR